MFQSFIILFRETLEAALIIGVALSYLKRTGQSAYKGMVWLGVLAGTVFSVLGAFGFQRLAGGFSGQAEAVFEGLTMLLGAALLTGMIFWMMRQSSAAAQLEEKVETRLSRSRNAGLFLLVFVSILREGIESVIFLSAARFTSQENNLVAGLLGVAAAAVFGYLLMLGSVRINLKRFFAVINVLLVMFAAGLIAHGIHELQEAGWLPIVVEHVWDLNPAVTTGAPVPLLHENGYVGSIAKGLFGYNGNPSLLEVGGYAVYLIFSVLFWRSAGKKRRAQDSPDSRAETAV